jgi:hypothetical protein
MNDFDLPTNPDTDAAGDRGYGDQGMEQEQGDEQPNSLEPDVDSDVEGGSNDFAEWHELGFDLDGER